MKPFAVLAVLIVALICVSVAGAQGTPPDVIGDIPSPDEIAGVFYTALVGLLASVAGGALASSLTTFVKRLPQFVDIDAGLIKLVVSIAVVVIGLAADAFGFKVVFEQAAQIIVAVIVVLTGGVSVSADLWYKKALSGVPYFGTTRAGIPADQDTG